LKHVKFIVFHVINALMLFPCRCELNQGCPIYFVTSLGQPHIPNTLRCSHEHRSCLEMVYFHKCAQYISIQYIIVICGLRQLFENYLTISKLLMLCGVGFQMDKCKDLFGPLKLVFQFFVFVVVMLQMCSMCGACIDASNICLITIILGFERSIGGFTSYNLHWIDMLMLSSNTSFKKGTYQSPKPLLFSWWLVKCFKHIW
jgi:hypothetical protein